MSTNKQLSLTDGIGAVNCTALVFVEGTTVVITPLPPWICACHEKIWREHWDPAHIPTFVQVTVVLDYNVGDFDKIRQEQLSFVIAHVVGVEEED